MSETPRTDAVTAHYKITKQSRHAHKLFGLLRAYAILERDFNAAVECIRQIESEPHTPFSTVAQSMIESVKRAANAGGQRPPASGGTSEPPCSQIGGAT